ncbi:MAG: hypothetical protein KDE68_04260 [Rhodocyclaceae bacterium]|nr:hypothetical protein [Rhodocyclaceae bacterium]
MFHLQQLRAHLSQPEKSESGQVFRDLLGALERGSSFDMSRLDALSYKEFDMAVECIREWRSLRYIQPDDPVYAFPLNG